MSNKPPIHQDNTRFQLDQILHNFFDLYELETCRAEIWNLLLAYASILQDEIPSREDRSNTVFFCKNLDALLRDLTRIYREGKAITG